MMSSDRMEGSAAADGLYPDNVLETEPAEQPGWTQDSPATFTRPARRPR